MIKSNWNIFRSKFSENLQDNFEWLCYLLFSKEFGKPIGIFRYKNQSAIETNPIEYGDNIIGWQAKFYDTTLSNNKDEIIEAITKCKKDYPEVNKLLIYTNQEWAQNKGAPPQGLIDIEGKASELNVTLDWRAASFFDSEFVAVQNEVLCKYFFSFENNIYDAIEDLQRHAIRILSEIRTEMSFNGIPFEITRVSELEELENNSNQVIIVSGDGGVGKTAIIKKFYSKIKDDYPFYIFKATEFELRSINELIPNINLNNFIEEHIEHKIKIAVIDSAEKLLDLKNTDPFKEFVSILIEKDWKIIITTRKTYLENLNYQFFEIYNVATANISIDRLSLDELSLISESNSFQLPEDQKLNELLRIPFYLNEYLKYYNDIKKLGYQEFKKGLWNKNIRKTKAEREICFLKLSFEKVNKGEFYITPSLEMVSAADELVRDGILAYESSGYFITHDIYEEWALEIIIETEFNKKQSNGNFFVKIGHSLAIRRSFRGWLSEKLLLENAEIKGFIEAVFVDEGIFQYWKDELLVSVMLSEYSKSFFEIFKKELLANDQALLQKVTFLLRIACKDIDDSLVKLLGKKPINIFYLNLILTKPKGEGWGSLIQFAFENLDTIGMENINFIVPIVFEWCDRIKVGATTRFSGLIALNYYKWTVEKKVYLSPKSIKDQLIKAIINSASEIKNELIDIFSEISEKKWIRHGDPFYELSIAILTKPDALPLVKVIPLCILELANLFWPLQSEKDKDDRFHHSIDIDHYFGLEENRFYYHPASAYQTPIYWLLSFSFKETIDFIIKFVNKSVRHYAQSGFDGSVEKVQVLGETFIKEQYISNCLWNMYRGTGSPVSPYLLQSLHMALEKFLLEVAEALDSDKLEGWLLYLLRNSESASISAIVASIVFAYPKKTFNVAVILFKTKEFIILDTDRFIAEQQAKTTYSLGATMGNPATKLFDEERIKTCEEAHRKWRLEDLFLYYQTFRNEGESEDDGKERQKILWEILDSFYQSLQDESGDEKESTKAWRLALARMDRRKMTITAEEGEGSIKIQFKPELEPDLQEYSNQSLSRSSEQLKYISLNLWAHQKFEANDEYKKYEKYEADPRIAFQEMTEILNKLELVVPPDRYELQHSEDERFFILNRSIPAYVAAVLIENHSEEFSNEELSVCKDVILDLARYSLQLNYRYQIDDGVQPAISALPALLKIFPEEIELVKIILLLALFVEYPVGGLFSTESFSIFAVAAIKKWRENNFDHVHTFLLGYLWLKPKYDTLIRLWHRGHYSSEKNVTIEGYIKENESDLEKFIKNELTSKDITTNIRNLDLHILRTAFRLILIDVNYTGNEEIAKQIIATYAKALLSEDRNNRIDFKVKSDFLESYAYFVLSIDSTKIKSYLSPFLDNFSISENMADLFEEFILAEDKMNTYDKFWIVWKEFKDKIIEASKKSGGRYWDRDKVIKSYLFATVSWKEGAEKWRSLKNNDKRFFKDISENIGAFPSTLHSISRLLNNIGSLYLEDGIIWISDIFQKNENYDIEEIESDTIYYIENFSRKFIFRNRERIKKSKELNDRTIIILDFLIKKGSSVGYMLRESVL